MSISGNTDYRVSGQELLKMSEKLDWVCRDLDYCAETMIEILLSISPSHESIVRAMARFGALAYRVKETSHKANCELRDIGLVLAHTPIQKESAND